MKFVELAVGMSIVTPQLHPLGPSAVELYSHFHIRLRGMIIVHRAASSLPIFTKHISAQAIK